MTQYCPPLPGITNDIRTLHDIESAVRAHANCARDSREHHLGSARECLAAWRTEISERLKTFNVCGFWFIMTTPSKLLTSGGSGAGRRPQGRRNWARAWISPHGTHSACLRGALLFCYLYAMLPADHLCAIDYVSVIRI